MGADFIGWRGCPLQAELGRDGFLGKLKLRAYKAVIEQRVPQEQWPTITVEVRVTGRPDRQLRYSEICRELAAFEVGIPDCGTCPLAGGKPLGCYRYVSYPVDAITEQLLFEFFVEGLEEPDSIADQLYRDLVSHVDGEAGWYVERGEDGLLAEREEPLEHAWGSNGDVQRVDSAQLLAALFIQLDELPLVVAYARFWLEFFQYVDRRLDAAGVRVEGDALEIHLDGGYGLDPEGIADQAVGSLALAKEIADSRTLGELRHVSEMMTAALPGAVADGWTIVVDG